MATRHNQVVLAAPDVQYISPASRPDYLTAAHHASKHTFCGNAEGWGPLSPYRYDFTPCFLDVWISAVAVWGIVLGGAALLYLFRKKAAAEVKKDWHFYTKLAVIAAVIATTTVQAVLQILALPNIWYQDFRFWTSIITLASLLVVGGVQYVEHWRSRTPNGAVLFYWLFLLIAYGVKLRSLVAQRAFETRLPYFVTFNVGLGLALLEFILEWLVPKKQSVYDEISRQDESPIEYANVFSILTFNYITPMMKYGYSHYLTQDDLPNLRKRDTTEVCGEAMTKTWEAELEKKNPNLWIAMFRAFGSPYVRGAMIKIVSDCLSFVQPQLLRLLISWVDSRDESNSTPPQPVTRGVAIALCMFAVSASQTMALNQYFQRAFDAGARVRAALTHMIYDKSMRLSSEGRSSKTTGDIVNYMAVDTQRLQDLTQYAQQAWSAPFQITLCMISLYQLVGWSMLAGVGVMILSIPVNGFVAKYMKKLQKVQMKNKDSRTRLMTEILNNIKSIKLYAWSQAFMKKLTYIRNDLELNTLRKIGAMSAVQNFTWASTPIAVSTATFTVFVLTKSAPLTTEIVFPALTLFNMLSFPLMMLPMVITAIIEATVAVGRLTEFLQAEELQPDAVTRMGSVDHVGDESVVVQDGSFTWDRTIGKRCLSDINFTARKGELSCIVGRVGSGKSSLLQALLGDVWKLEGDVVLHGAVAYVAQSSWVMNASVRENIVFGHRWDADFYEKTVKACALQEDFRSLPDGDRTEVGEKGISLSGGQKARLTLARAVYARADIYLLDDVLSAVDQHVGRHLIENVLGSKGLLASKTRILATNAIPVLNHADYISMLRDGKILEKGTFDQLMAMRGEVSMLVKTASKDSGESTPDETSSISESESPDSDESKTQVGTNPVSDEEDGRQLAPIKAGGSTSLDRQKSNITLRRASTASFRGPRGTVTDEEDGLKTKKTEEHSEQGKVKWDVYGEYAKSNNLVAVAIYMIALIGARTLDILGSLWLKSWAKANQDAGENPDVGRYIGVYFGFGLSSALLMVIQTLILWIFCSIEASRKLHERMAYAVFRSPMSFFETNPIGRILNRFSSDVYKVDEVLARTFNMLFVNGARAAFTLGLVVASTPYFLALIPFVGAIYIYIQRYYLRTSRELKRLDSVSKSPIYAHFQETLGGLTTIRAYRQQKRFSLENEWRVDANLQCYFPSTHANRWLAIRLELIGSCIIFAAAMLAIISITLGSGPDAGLVGLSLAYALQITQSLNWIVRQTVEVETNIVSVERCLEYARLPSEAPEVLHKRRPKANWPHRGAVSFSNYSTRYRQGLDLVLKDVNLNFKAKEKIGVVGRTGAGKSSLTLALFRIIEPASGNITIDDTNTSAIGLHDLRSRLAIIPQDAALFEGTVRDNLDPSHVHDDTQLWSVLDHARLKDHVSGMDGQLEARIQEGGSNLSQGQRQLISLARALLTPTNILVLDEATAAVDIETDALLQETLRSSVFRDRTIITIAHRINTILDSDRIVVLDHGKVAEFDSPDALVKKRGLFYELVREAGLLDGFE